MAIYTFDQAVKKAGVKPSEVKSFGVPQIEAKPVSSPNTFQRMGGALVDNIKSIPSDFNNAVQSFGNTFGDAGTKIRNVLTEDTDPNKVDSLGRTLEKTNLVGGAIGKAIYSGASAFLSPIIQDVANIISESKTVQAVSQKGGGPIGDILATKKQEITSKVDKIIQENPREAENIKAAFDILMGSLTLATISPKNTVNLVTDTIDKTKSSIGGFTSKPPPPPGAPPPPPVTRMLSETNQETLFGRNAPINNVDDVVREAERTLSPAKIKAKTNAVTSKPSLIEKWAGISPDIKNRIAGKQDRLQEYFDVAHARNNFDTLPTPFEHGADRVYKAVDSIEAQLNDTGSQIGQFRTKISTYKAPIESVGKIEKSFTDQVTRLNLEVKNGVVRQKPGTIGRTNSPNEIKVLNDLYKDLQTAKQSPTLQNLIDLRNKFDSRINFDKSTRDVSSSLDPLSRMVRAQIADVAAQVVGKSEAANLIKYSDVMDALNDLKSFTDRKAGAEFLLKQVFSDKGGTARKTIQTIKDLTGIDLLDDATMATIATDLIGNARQKGVLRQEITKAGLDVSAILKGNPTGAINLLFEYGKKALLNQEKIFLNAAKGGQKSTTPIKSNTAPTSNTSSRIIPKSVPSKGIVGKTIDRFKNTPNKQGGFIRIGGKTFSEITDATKREMVQVINYLRTGKGVSKIEDTLSRLARKYNISQDLPSSQIANKFEDLIDKTKTK